MDDEELDVLITKAVGDEWTKIAVVISKVYDEYEALESKEQAVGLSRHIAERIYILVDNGRLDVQGNMRRWRDASIRLIGAE